MRSAAGPPPAPVEGTSARATLRAASRMAQLGGQALHAIGSARVELRGLPSETRLRAQAGRLRLGCAEVCRSHGFLVHLSGHLPRGPVVLVANHLSYIDP